MRLFRSSRPQVPLLLPVLVAALLAGLGMGRSAGAIAVEAVPSPRPDGWSVDLTGSIQPAVLRELDALAERVHAETGGELVVVVVDSVDGAEPRAFATAIFNTWGIGSRGRDDGVLVFLARAERAAEIVLGDGLDGPGGLAASDRAMQVEMVPRFRAGAMGEGLRAGARALAEEIFGVVDSSAHRSAAVVPAPLPLAVERPPRARVRTPPASSLRRAYAPAPGWRAAEVAIIVALVLILVGLGGIAAGAALAYRPPRCASCRVRRVKLDEASEEEHLEPVQRLEEEIGSVDHQVWICPSCGDLVELARNRWFSGYSTCSACAARTWRSSEHVVTYATTQREGLAQVDGRCVSCDHRTSYTRTIPRKIDWSDEDTGRPRRVSSFSSSGSRSSSSSSSSSRSSSFGGGRSSGGGSSGRW